MCSSDLKVYSASAAEFVNRFIGMIFGNIGELQSMSWNMRKAVNHSVFLYVGRFHKKVEF